MAVAPTTQSAWVSKTVNNHFTSVCTVLADATKNDSYTLQTPAGLDTNRPFTVSVTFSGTPDGEALPIDIWASWSDDGALDAEDPPTSTTAVKVKQILDDCVLAVSGLQYTVAIVPHSGGSTLNKADNVAVATLSTGLTANVVPAPYYIFNLNGGSSLAAETATWRLTQ